MKRTISTKPLYEAACSGAKSSRVTCTRDGQHWQCGMTTCPAKKGTTSPGCPGEQGQGAGSGAQSNTTLCRCHHVSPPTPRQAVEPRRHLADQLGQLPQLPLAGSDHAARQDLRWTVGSQRRCSKEAKTGSGQHRLNKDYEQCTGRHSGRHSSCEAQGSGEKAAQAVQPTSISRCRPTRLRPAKGAATPSCHTVLLVP